MSGFGFADADGRPVLLARSDLTREEASFLDDVSELLEAHELPVVDVLLTRTGTANHDGSDGRGLRVEFRHPTGGVGVVSGVLCDWYLHVYAPLGLPTSPSSRKGFSRDLDELRHARALDRDEPHEYASNESLRTLLAARTTDPSAVERALTLVRESPVRSIRRMDVRTALTVRVTEEAREHVEAAVTLLADLASGVPEEWALRRALTGAES